MLSTDLYIVTPFSRDQVSMIGKCIDYIDPKYTPYQVFVFESRMQPFLDKYFQNKPSYKYDHFVFYDLPSQGQMITTMRLMDIHGNPVELQPEMIRDINLEITNVTTLHPNYCLFYSDQSTKLSRPWVRALLPSFIFERVVYEFFEDPKPILIPSIVENGCIYLDLSEEMDYNGVVQKLSIGLNDTLEKFYQMGTLPEMLTPVDCIENDKYNLCKIIDDPALYKRQPGQFVHYEGQVGDQVLEDLAGIQNVQIPVSDTRILSSVNKSTSTENSSYATVYVVNFNRVDPDMVLTEDQIGAEFLVSLKNFLDADAVISKEVSPGYFQIYVNKKGKYIESGINIKEMFGYQFLTHHPMGLLAVQDLGLLQDSKIIYDSYNNIGGVFVPLVYLGDILELETIKIQLNNRLLSTDAYTLNGRIEKQILKHQLKVVAKIDQYIFVEKSSIITKRIIYRTLQEQNPEMLIVGEWNFIQMNPNYIIDLVNQLLKEHHVQKNPNVRVGPFSSLIVPVLPRLAMERFIELIHIHLKQKYNFGRQF